MLPVVLHSILLKKSLNINLPFLFYKVLYSGLSNKSVLKGIIRFHNKQIWLPPSDSYIMHVLLQSDTAGHYQAIGDRLGDQVNMASKDRS